jgi:TolA-binding protein
MRKVLAFVALLTLAAPAHAADPKEASMVLQIELLQRLISDTADADPDKLVLYFRSATLAEEMRRAKAARAAVASGEAKAALLKEEQRWLLTALKQYLAVLDHADRAGGYARTDEVLFRVSTMLTEAHQEAVARKHFQRLITDFPRSRFIPDAYLSFGDYFFEQREFANALELYAKVLETPDARVAPYAHYKVGWCHANQDQWQQALEEFVALGKARPDGDASKRTLVSQARRDAVRAYTRVGLPEEARAFFERAFGGEDDEWIDLLAVEYEKRGLTNECRRIGAAARCD